MSILLVISGAALIAWLYLLLAHGRFWRTSERLPPAPALESWPGVVAIIPARNEADVIGRAVASHMETAYPGEFQIVLVDDGSTDGTAEAAVEADNGVRRLTVLKAAPLPSGWSGKLWALQNGLDAIEDIAPDADYVLFTDADIVHSPATLAQLVGKAETEKRGLVSLMALLDADGPWGSLLVPAFVFFFQKLYPFALVNDPAQSTAAAAGGCVLVKRALLRQAGGLHSIKDALIDDCALARLIKHGLGNGTEDREGDRAKEGANGAPIWLGLTRSVGSLRENRKLSSIWTMVKRTAFTQLGHSPWMLAGTVAGMLLLYLAAPLIVLTAPLHGSASAAALGFAAWTIMTLTYFPMLTLYGKSGWLALALPAAALLYTAMTVDSALAHWRGQGGWWKGRTYEKPT